jgi:thiol-disulfide isomerase/thioredoxin
LLSSRSLKLAVLGFAFIGAGCDRQSGDAAQPAATASAPAEAIGTVDRSHKGEPIPPMMLRDASNRTLALDSLKGKPVLVNLWATWCAPCIAELPTLERLAGNSRATLKVLTVSQDMAKTENVAPFLKEKGGFNLEPWLDPKNELAFRYRAQTLPTTVLYDAGGKEVWRFAGGNEWDGVEAAKLIAEAR